MTRDLAKRLARLEKQVAAVAPAPKSRAEMRDGIMTVFRLEAALVAFYKGGWTSGSDGMACVQAGLAAACTGGMNTSLTWAASKAEHVFSGELGEWHTAERMQAAFDAIGPARAELWESIGDVFDRADEIGDKVLINIAERYSADAPSTDPAPASGGNRAFLKERLELTHQDTHPDV